jgi:predicted O-linked N-acetylglucosamine transferase (SPINDLY family)
MGRLDEAVEAYESAVALAPNEPVLRAALADTLSDQARLPEAIVQFRKRAELMPDSPAAGSAVLFTLLHDPDVSPEALFEEHRLWCRRLACHTRGSEDAGRKPAAQSRQEAGGTPAPQRIGYVSPDLRDHTVARFFEPVLANHDPRRVTSVCYSDVRRPDAVTDRLRAAATEWRDTADLDDDALAELIRRDRIDVLVDLTGHLAGNRLGVFARRPAPVQASYIAYPHSTGLGAIDWRITDAASDPPGVAERHHVERLIRLDGCAWCYRPDDDSPDPTEPPAGGTGT